MFSPEEQRACERLIDLALAEDLGERGDVTSQAVIPQDLQGRAVFLAKATGIVAGLSAAELVMKAVDAQIRFEYLKQDGDRVAPRERLATVAGPMRSILAAERTALNFLQHLSGVATMTRRYVNEVAGTDAEILDTRKTLPGWRLLEKYAVRQGGGHNHRMGLHDAILIKDNHLAALPIADWGMRIAESVRQAQEQFPSLPLEIEVESLAQLENALVVGPHIVLLDNMSPNLLCDCVALRNQIAPGVRLEASGGITLANVRSVAETGVRRISIGALTHSAPTLDMALDYETA